MKNSKSLKNQFNKKTILITGGTGSFGKEFLNYLLDKNLKEIRIFSRDELKQDELRNKYNKKNISFYIGDVRNLSSIDYAMKNVDYVFHAAALKQVPSCEFFPSEAVLTNVNGSENVIKSCIKNNVKAFVGLSTDKAVYPINVMGMTKALMEKTSIAYSKKKIFLQIIDFSWRSHLQYLEQLRQVIGLRSYGQKDPLLEFKKEAFALFEVLLEKIKGDVVKFLLNLNLVVSSQNEKQSSSEEFNANETKKRKIKRNEKCPCGSGKKYKHCCGSV